MIKNISNNISELLRIDKILIDFGFEYASIGYSQKILYADEDRTTINYDYHIDFPSYSDSYSLYYVIKMYVHCFKNNIELEVSHRLINDDMKILDSDLTDVKLKNMISYFEQLSIEDLEKSEKKDTKYKDRKEKDSYVYIMTNKRNGYSKIGISNNPKYRESTLQSQEPEVKLIFKRIVVNPRDSEKKLHNHYSEHRLRGEWFDLTPEQIEECKELIKKETSLINT